MENKEYRYYKDEDGSIYRMHIESDDTPPNPRTEFDGNLGVMFCKHRSYRLGDNLSYSELDGMMRAIIEELHIPMQKIRDLFQKITYRTELRYNSTTKEWEIWHRGLWCDQKTLYSYDTDLEMLDDDLIECLSESDVETLQKLAGDQLIILPIFFYDHGGITINTTGFSCIWDSGQCGWIWTTLDRVKAAGVKKENDEEYIQFAKEALKAEVDTYDQYLCGDVYGYIEEKLQDDETWEETESVWGFYAATADPLKEIADDIYGKDNHVEDLTQLSAA